MIIHLTRNNILRSFASKQIGLKTRKWTENIHRPHELNLDGKKVILKSKECIQNFESVENYIIKTNNRFSRHFIIPVVYEDLDKDKQVEMSRIFKELGVEDLIVDTFMKKQNSEKLEGLIINFKELRSDHKGTKWEYLFKEEL